MKRMLLAGVLALAPLSAAAAELPYLNCLPAQNGPVCKNPKPMALLGSNLECELCNAAHGEPPSTVDKGDKGKAMTPFCEALRMMSILSPCDEMRSDMARTDRTTM